MPVFTGVESGIGDCLLCWRLVNGIYRPCFQAPRPSTGPHKLRECLPLIIFLRNRLKYALTGDEVKKICMQRFIKIDGKVRTDVTYPAGFMGKSAYSVWIMACDITHTHLTGNGTLLTQVLNTQTYTCMMQDIFAQV